MLKITNSGALYIIGEHSHDGAPTDLYKIGIVRDNERSRSVDERLREHQTGNPRELFIAHVKQTPLVERIETLLHGQHATRRIGGEWFHLPGSGLHDVIAVAAAHIVTAHNIAPILDEAVELAETPSSGKVIAASPDHVALHHDFIDVRAQLTACQNAIDHLTTQLLARQHIEQPERPWVQLDVKAPRRTFDKKAFAAAHPDIYEQYLIKKETFTKTFRPNLRGAATPLDVANPDVSEASDTAATLNADTTDGDTLHRTYLAMLEHHAPLLWLHDQLETSMRIACRDNDGIADICTWKRSTANRPELDTDALRTDHPDLFGQFAQTGQPITAATPLKDRNYRQ